MMSTFWRSAAFTAGGAAALILFAWISPVLANIGGERGERFVDRVFRRGLNTQDALGPNQGYYEVLMSPAAGPPTALAAVLGRQLLGWKTSDQFRPPQILRRRNDFLYHDFEPNRHFEFTDLTTNSAGMHDLEYSLAKPENTHRIVVIGDSISRGYGATFGHNWESLLENRLNEEFGGRSFSRYEVVNSSVDGYLITQMMDIALERTQAYDPDLYLLGMSPLTYRADTWSRHIVDLIEKDYDLKYDTLRDIVGRSGARSGMSRVEIAERLRPFKREISEFALRLVKSAADSQRAPVYVVFLPMVDQSEQFGADAVEFRTVLEDLSIQVLDLSETFQGISDLRPYQYFHTHYEWFDPHPNNAGNLLLYEALYARIRADDEMLAAFTGGLR